MNRQLREAIVWATAIVAIVAVGTAAIAGASGLTRKINDLDYEHGTLQGEIVVQGNDLRTIARYLESAQDTIRRLKYQLVTTKKCL